MSNDKLELVANLPVPIRRGLYFGLQRLIGSRIHQHWHEFQTWERFSPGQLEAAVDQRLDTMLDHARKHSSYYRHLNISGVGASHAKDFLARFPILDRSALRERFHELVVDRLCDQIRSPSSRSSKRYDWLVVKTGGTTGVPTAVVHDPPYRDAGRAGRLLSAQLCGFPLGTPYFRLWGSEADLLDQQEKLQPRLLRAVLGEIPMNAFRAKSPELRRHWETLRSRPAVRHMMAYVDAAVSLASFIEDQSLPAPKLATIMACAGTVTKEARTILKRVFQAEIFDKYGSRECADMACECSAHAGLHVYSPNVHVEIVDETGRACPPGTPGRVLVTLLQNFAFPMIRYEIGDVGVWAAPGSCVCGRSFPRLERIEGRQDEMLVAEDRTLVSPAFIRHFVGVSLNRELIREWQFEQTGSASFVFRFVPLREQGLAENLKDLDQSFRKVLGNAVEILQERVEEIPPSPTGKQRWIINRLRSPSRKNGSSDYSPSGA